jgi:hypothetical protein
VENINERVRWGLHYLDNNPDPDQDWMPYFGAIITGTPSYYAHSAWDACDVGWRMVEAYILARQVLGQPTPGEAEQRLRAFVLGTIRNDGLSYRPDRLWCQPDAWMWDHGRALIALATWLRLEPADETASIAHRMAEGLARIALRESDYWCFPAESWTGTGWSSDIAAHPPTGLAIEGLTDLARLLADDCLLEMAGYFVRAVRTRQPYLFAEDGSLVRMGGGPYKFAFTHIHSRLAVLIGLLKYALATRDSELRAWCVRAYLFVKEKMSSSFGWVPESLESGTDEGVTFLSTRRRDEVCSISDMMQLAAILAHNGWPEERSTIGRYGTNQVFAHQLVDFTPLRHLMVDSKDQTDTQEISYRDMPDRCLGAFTAGTYPNELTVDLRSFGAPEHSVDAAGCCSPAGIKALHVLWREAVERNENRMHIHLWATLENDDLIMCCDEPTSGQMRIQIKRPCDDLVIHLPDYLLAHQISVSQGKMETDGNKHLGATHAGEVISVAYPLPERRATEEIAGAKYQVHWKGGRVVEILPPAVGCAPYWWRAVAH